MNKLREKFRAWRKRRGFLLPFVRRERFNRKVSYLRELRGIDRRRRGEYVALARMLLAPADALATKARIAPVIPIDPTETDELCLFVTHAPAPALKQHVVDHVNALIDARVAVVLIINTDHEAAEFSLPPDFSSRLRGLLVRQNIGFDFAAWAHALCLLPPGMTRRRLYLVNDSIVGPLDQADYRRMLERIRGSKADMIGLTLNTWPKTHLQSFYMVFGDRLFRSPLFANVMANVLNLPSKEAAIYAYEIQLTEYFQEHGFHCEALFPNMADGGRTDDVYFRWTRLIESGFPFIKASTLREAAGSAEIARLVPERYR